MTRRLSEAEAMQIPAVAAAIRAERETALDGAAEAQVVKEITDALEVLGYRRLDKFKWGQSPTGFYVRIGQRRADLAGTDKGCPDLMVYTIGKGWKGFEIKARVKNAPVRREQEILAKFEAILIVDRASQVIAGLESL